MCALGLLKGEASFSYRPTGGVAEGMKGLGLGSPSGASSLRKGKSYHPLEARSDSRRLCRMGNPSLPSRVAHVQGREEGCG